MQTSQRLHAGQTSEAIKVIRTDHHDRRPRSKSNTIDAENTAHAALSGQTTAIPKTHDGTVETIRQVKVAKDVTVNAPTAAIISLKQVLVNAPPEIREELKPLTKMMLIAKRADLRPSPVTTITASTKHTLHAIAQHWQQLNSKTARHEEVLAALTTQAPPQLAASFTLRPDTATQILIVTGNNPDRVRSETAFAKGSAARLGDRL